MSLFIENKTLSFEGVDIEIRELSMANLLKLKEDGSNLIDLCTNLTKEQIESLSISGFNRLVKEIKEFNPDVFEKVDGDSEGGKK